MKKLLSWTRTWPTRQEKQTGPLCGLPVFRRFPRSTARYVSVMPLPEAHMGPLIEAQNVA
jgi:hypothetical protein